MNDLLLEIGCENLPPHAIRPAYQHLERKTAERLSEMRLPYDSIYTAGAPRRMVLVVRGLAAAQTAKTETVTGPPVARAFDEAGKPTKAATGFAKSGGVAVDKLQRVETERGEYLAFTRKLSTRRASALLKTVLPELIAGVKWPKLMHWESSGRRFARPIRWVVCLLGNQVIRFDIAGVRSGDVTCTMPWIHRKRIKVRNADHYLAAMKKAGVIVDPGERTKLIEKLAKKTAERLRLTLVEDRGLVHELTYMLETPKALVGDFDGKYLSLPPDIVTTAMKAHQRYMAFRDKKSKLVPKFLTFTEGKVGSPAVVRKGNEKVLRARLEDALFYWNEDLKTNVDRLSAKLGAIVFIEGLGTLADKSRRLAKLALLVNGMLDERSRVAPDSIERAAGLAKADLASEMIKDGKEFTLLQGRIGSHYARQAGEKQEVVDALGEQYLPVGPSDPLPRTPLGTLLSVCDRIDTIAGCFLAGLVPTSSQDPYALRRQANGLLRMLEGKPSVEIAPLLGAALGAYSDKGYGGGGDTAEVMIALEEFFKTRVGAYLRDNGIDYDIVAAVAAVAWQNPGIALTRARVVQGLRDDESFRLLVTGAKRVSNIIAKPLKRYGTGWDALKEAFTGSGALSGDIRFSPGNLQEEAEKRLHTAIGQALPRLVSFEGNADERSMLKTLSGLGPVIDAYFDQVLVNCPDESLRADRHAFLAAVFALFSRYADLSHIVEEGVPATR